MQKKGEAAQIMIKATPTVEAFEIAASVMGPGRYHKAVCQSIFVL